jgi:type IV pilus assembly protein PilE
LDTAQQLERCRTRFNTYNNAMCQIAADLVAGVPSPEGWYIVTDSAPAATSFALVATPQGAQTADTRCVNLTLNSQGVRGATGSLGADCW